MLLHLDWTHVHDRLPSWLRGFVGDRIGGRPLDHRSRLALALLDLVLRHTLVLHPVAAAVLGAGPAPSLVLANGWAVLHRCSLVGHRASFLHKACVGGRR